MSYIVEATVALMRVSMAAALMVLILMPAGRMEDVGQMFVPKQGNAVSMEQAALERERRMQKTMLEIKRRFGKNAILKGMNLDEGATTISRNGQIGGHKA